MQAKAAPDQEDRVKQRAYEIWEMEGRPHGRDKEHWQRAVREMEDDQTGVAPPVAELMPPVAKPEAQQGGSSPAKRGGRASALANGVADRRV